jgi:hypothetical protein
MALLTQYRSFYISPFGEPAACDKLNGFLRSHRMSMWKNGLSTAGA